MDCGKVRPGPKYTRCSKCRRKNAARAKARRKERAELGLCRDCGLPKEDKTACRCNTCAEINRLGQLEGIRRNADKIKERRRLRIANGLCVYCTNKASRGKQCCSECSVRYSKISRKNYYALKNLGRCTYCGAMSDGMTRCRDCAEKRSQAKKSRRLVLTS